MVQLSKPGKQTAHTLQDCHLLVLSSSESLEGWIWKPAPSVLGVPIVEQLFCYCEVLLFCTK